MNDKEDASRIVSGVPFSDYLPQGYTIDPGFRMPTVSEPPAEPATPIQSKIVYGFDPGTQHGVLAYRDGDKITIMEEGRFVAQGVIGGTMKDGVQYKATRGAPVYMVDGKIVALDAEYHERTYQDYLAWLFDESHIVRGYD